MKHIKTFEAFDPDYLMSESFNNFFENTCNEAFFNKMKKAIVGEKPYIAQIEKPQNQETWIKLALKYNGDKHIGVKDAKEEDYRRVLKLAKENDYNIDKLTDQKDKDILKYFIAKGKYQDEVQHGTYGHGFGAGAGA